ncbi:MAG: class I SAM-dependent methyltransferase, partial [Alicyclobacillus sp.]|nr:class I SAM-dependent methyltransferase [Alicyclobacillus sp.]
AYHFAQPQSFLKEAARVLQPGGWFWLSDNVAPEDPHVAETYNQIEALRDPTHVRCATRREWLTWLQQTGFTVERETTLRKRLLFRPWMERAAAGESSRTAEVTARLLAAPPAVRTFLQVEMNESEIEAISLDQWVVLARYQG